MKFNQINEKKIEQMNCSICGSEIEVEENGWYNGHSAKPVTEGRCCSVCNIEVVAPTRTMFGESLKKLRKSSG